MQWTVIENTPGYMPVGDVAPLFDDYAEAVKYLNERCAEYADDPDGNYSVDYGWASSGNYAAAMIHDHNKTHDLGRWIAVEAVEPSDNWEG